MRRIHTVRGLASWWCAAALIVGAVPASAQDARAGATQTPAPDQQAPPAPPADGAFRLGEIVYVLGREPGKPGIGDTVVTHEQLRTFEKHSLDQAVNLAPGASARLTRTVGGTSPTSSCAGSADGSIRERHAGCDGVAPRRQW
jgi:hypothetical protein